MKISHVKVPYQLDQNWFFYFSPNIIVWAIPLIFIEFRFLDLMFLATCLLWNVEDFSELAIFLSKNNIQIYCKFNKSHLRHLSWNNFVKSYNLFGYEHLFFNAYEDSINLLNSNNLSYFNKYDFIHNVSFYYHLFMCY